MEIDGKEIRLSQLMSDKGSDEEIEAGTGRGGPIRMHEDSGENIAEIKFMEASGLSGTREISAPNFKDGKPAIYDQTNFDGISQLWGLPPGEITNIPRHEVDLSSSLEQNTFEGISQLWSEGIAVAADTEPNSSEVPASLFEGITQLWGNN